MTKPIESNEMDLIFTNSVISLVGVLGTILSKCAVLLYLSSIATTTDPNFLTYSYVAQALLF